MECASGCSIYESSQIGDLCSGKLCGMFVSIFLTVFVLIALYVSSVHLKFGNKDAECGSNSI